MTDDAQFAIENEKLRHLLKKIWTHGLHHHDSCSNVDCDEELECDCGLEKLEVMIRMVFENHKILV